MRPLLLQIGPKVMCIGENSQALIVKLAINNTLVVEMVAFCENVATAEKDGVKREVAVEALLQSVISSPMLQYRGEPAPAQPQISSTVPDGGSHRGLGWPGRRSERPSAPHDVPRGHGRGLTPDMAGFRQLDVAGGTTRRRSRSAASSTASMMAL